MMPTCTKENPYRGPRSSFHPDLVPVTVNDRGHIEIECPNCGLRCDTDMTERAFFAQAGILLPEAPAS